MNSISWILTVAALGAVGLAAFSKGNLSNIFAQLKQTRADVEAQVTDEIQGAADYANVAVDSVKDVAKKLWTPPKSASEYLTMIDNATRTYNLPPLLLARLLWQESHFRPEIISGKLQSGKGATGIAQFLPSTAADLGIDPNNPREAIPAAASYLKGLYLQFNDWEKAVAAYDWGQGNVSRKWNGVDKLPKETHDYVIGVLGDVGLI